MYAVSATGGKQERGAEGQRVDVELLGVDEGAEVSFHPVLVVDGEQVLATPDQPRGSTVTAMCSYRSPTRDWTPGTNLWSSAG